MKSSSSLVSPSLAARERSHSGFYYRNIFNTHYKSKCIRFILYCIISAIIWFVMKTFLWQPWVCAFEERSSRFGDTRGGELVAGESTVGEFSLSSLKLKLFLLSDSAPVGMNKETEVQTNEMAMGFTFRSTTLHQQRSDLCQRSISSVWSCGTNVQVSGVRSESSSQPADHWGMQVWSLQWHLFSIISNQRLCAAMLDNCTR